MHADADSRTSARDRAFERLYRRYVTDVYRYTLALLRNPADAEDVTQTTFLNAYRAYRRGEEPRKPQNWLITIAHNACRTRYVRASRRPQEVPLEQSLRELAVPQDEIPDVQAVLDALAKLPFNQRSALVMRELEGRSYREIARALDVTVPAVETLIFRARRSLRVRTSALRALGALPLPSSLSSFSGGAGAVAAGSGAAFGSGLLLKAVLAVGMGIAAGTAGPTVEAKILGGRAVEEPIVAPTGSAAPADRRAAAAARASALRLGGVRSKTLRAVEGTADAQGSLPRHGPTMAGGTAPGSTGAGPAPAETGGSAAAPPTSPATAATETVGKTAVPDVPAAVPLPAVEVPALPAVPVPTQPPVDVPPVPPPPPLPPPPTLP